MKPEVKAILAKMRLRKRLMQELNVAKATLLQTKEPDKKLLAMIDAELAELEKQP